MSSLPGIVLPLLVAQSAQLAPVPPVERASTQTFAIRFAEGANWKPSTFQVARGIILLRATVSGQSVLVLLDNGTERTTIDSGFARRNGLTLRNTGLKMRAGATELTTHQAEGVTIMLPNMLTVEGQTAAIDLAPISTALGQPVVAVLGGDVLERVAMMIRPSKRELAILPSGRITPGANAITLPIRNRNQVSGEINGKSVRLMIDLGSNGIARLTDAAFDQVIPMDAARQGESQTSADGIERETRVATATLKVGSVNANGVPITGGLKTAGVDGILGNGFFKQADTLFDFQRGLISMNIGRLTPTRPSVPSSP